MSAAYPIFLDLAGRQVAIIGGGTVAERKAAGVLQAGAHHVKAVSITFTSTFPAAVERIVRPYASADLEGASLVFAATDSAEVNDAVVADARARGIWVNRADAGAAAAGDFVTPAKFSSGPVTVAVAAGSAALTTLVRDGLARRFDPGWTTMADAMTTLRPMIRDQWRLPPDIRRQIFQELATDEAVRVLVDEGLDGLIAWLGGRHPWPV